MTLNIQVLPETILNDLKERGHTIEDIQNMSPSEAFKEYLEWNGIINWASHIRWALFEIITSDIEYLAHTDDKKERELKKLLGINS